MPGFALWQQATTIKTHIIHWVSTSLTVDQEVRDFLNHLILLHVPCHSSFFNQSGHAQQLQCLEWMPNHQDNLTWELTSSYVTLWCSSLAFQQWLFVSSAPEDGPWRRPLLPFYETVSNICSVVISHYCLQALQEFRTAESNWCTWNLAKDKNSGPSSNPCHDQKTCLLNLHRPRTAPDSSLITRWDAAGNS